MRKRPFRRSTGLIRSCRSPPAARNGMGSSTTGTGTLSLYAALNTHTGEVLGSAVPRHTSDEFVAFLTSVVEALPRRRETHIIVDNLSAHETQKVRTFLVAHPNVRLHCTPTYSSWLNQVELWFSKIEPNGRKPWRSLDHAADDLPRSRTQRGHPWAGRAQGRPRPGPSSR